MLRPLGGFWWVEKVKRWQENFKGRGGGDKGGLGLKGEIME